MTSAADVRGAGTPSPQLTPPKSNEHIFGAAANSPFSFTFQLPLAEERGHALETQVGADWLSKCSPVDETEWAGAKAASGAARSGR